MQGPRGSIGTHPDAVDLDQGSVSDYSVMNQQASWSIFDPIENRVPNSVMSSADSYISPVSSSGHDYHRFSGWDAGEPSSSSNRQNQVMDEGLKLDQGRCPQFGASSRASPGTSLGMEERPFERSKVILSNPMSVGSSENFTTPRRPLFMQTSRSNYIPENVNLNPVYTGKNIKNEHGMETGAQSDLYTSGGTETEHIASAVFSEHVGTSSGRCGTILEDNGGSDSSLGSWGLSCKRKTLEGTSGQCHLAGSSGCFTKAESTTWHTVPRQNNSSSRFNLSTTPWSSHAGTSSEQMNPRFNETTSTDSPPLNLIGNAESSLRNFGRSGNSGQVSMPFNLMQAETVRHLNAAPSFSQSPRPHSFAGSAESRPGVATDSRPSINSSQSPPHLAQFTGSSANVDSSIWNRGPFSRFGASSSSFNIPGDRGQGGREEINLRSAARINPEPAMHAPGIEARNLGQDPTSWSLSTGTSSTVPSASQLGPNSTIHPLPTPSWITHENHPSHNQQRLLGFAPWTLFPSLETDTFGHSGHFSPSPSGSTSGTDVVTSSRTTSEHERYTRSAFSRERQGDDPLSMLHPMRDVATNIEGRHRLISEIRQVLNAMRRGNSVRLEDSWLFEPFVYHRLPEMHDRHRDMRLDVDNMSYEELLALEERIGDVNTGLGEETILKSMKQHKYVATETAGEIEPCCICREEYYPEDDVGTLDCGHDFHANCVRQWLLLKNICPICKTPALATSEKT